RKIQFTQRVSRDAQASRYYPDLDLLGRQPDGFGLDADLGRRKLREYIILGAAKCVDPIGNENAGERGDNAAEANRRSNDRSLRTGGQSSAHCRSSSTWICARNSSDSSNCAPRVTISASFATSFAI